jgi:predicted metal-dependent peptidase
MQETMGCDKYWRVYVHPKALDNWSVEESAWVVLHECLGHLVRGHGLAAERYPKETPERLNIAQDLEIESWEWESGPAVRPSGKFAGLHPSKFNLPVGEVWEWYLENLPKGAASPQNCGSGAHGRPEEWELGAEGAPVQPGSAREKAIKQLAAEKIAMASKERGDVPAGLAVWANATLEPPHVDWRQALRSCIARQLAAGCVDMIGPARERRGLLMPRWRTPKPRIAIVADTSGSMSGEGGVVLGACVDICRTFGQIEVCWVDAETTWQTVRCRQDLRPIGGGGTDLRPAINEARKKKSDSIIIITDCETPWPEPCNRSVILATSGGNPPQNWRTINVN